MSIIVLAFSRVKGTHSYLYIKDRIYKNGAFKNLVSAFSTTADDEVLELILKSPTSSCSSLLSISSVVQDTLREKPIYDWEKIEKFLLSRE